MLRAVADGSVTVPSLLETSAVLDLHRQLYVDIWKWAGVVRVRELTIGILASRVWSELDSSLGNFAFQWEAGSVANPRLFSLQVHAELTRIHPFSDGNGRSSRLLADLVYAASQGTEFTTTFDWAISKPSYVEALRAYDASRDAERLNALVGDLILDDDQS